MKIISITPFTKKVLSLASDASPYGKALAKVVKGVLKVKIVFKKLFIHIYKGHDKF